MTEEQIRTAAEHFEKILRTQAERAERLARPKSKREQGKTVIGCIDGDGIGPVIMTEAKRVLKELLKEEIASGGIELKEIEGLTIENRMKLGRSVPEETLQEIRACDVLLKGPTTTPSGGKMESANVTLRRELDLFANTRPVQVPAEGIDWMFFRENTEGEYVLGSSGIEIPGLLAMDFKVTTEEGTRRIARAAFEYARKNGRKHVSIVTKSNIMKKTDGLFSRIAHEVAEEYPEITTEEYYIDIMTANLVNPEIRSTFEVFLLPNLYGDIITDEAAQIQGGVGTAGSANIGDSYAMFEAIHGSAPRLVEAGLGAYANPQSILTAAAMMLGHIGLKEQEKRLRLAIENAGRNVHVTGTKNGASCKEFGDAVLRFLMTEACS